MRTRALVISMLVLANQTFGQEFPAVTEEARKTAEEILQACVKAGALRVVVVNPATKATRLFLMDQDKLRQELAKLRGKLNSAVRDALLRRYQEPGAVFVLFEMGQVTGDRQARAFAQLFAARMMEHEQQLRQAAQTFEASATLFGELKMDRWQAAALNDQALLHKELGELDRAHRAGRKAVELGEKGHREPHGELATALNTLGLIQHARGELPEARRLLQRALAMREKLHPDPHLDIIVVRNSLAMVADTEGKREEAIRLYQKCLDQLKQLPGDRRREIASSLNNLGMVYLDLEQPRKARPLCQQALELREQAFGKEHPQVAQSLHDLAQICHLEGDLLQAIRLHRLALAMREKVLPERHPEVARSLHNLAETHRLLGELNQAGQLYTRTLDMLLQLQQPGHLVARTMSNLALVRHAQGDLPRARELHEKALALRVQVHGRRHLDVAHSLNNLALVDRDEGELARARRRHEEALDLCKQVVEEGHRDLAIFVHNLAEVCRLQGDLKEARRLHEQALDRIRGRGENHPLVAVARNNLALVCHAQGDLDRTVELYQQALGVWRKHHGERHPEVANALFNLAGARAARKELDEARALLREAVLASRVPGVKATQLDRLRAADFFPVPGSSTRLWWLATDQNEVARSLEQGRMAARTYQLAADVLDQLRDVALETEDSKLFHGAQRASLVADRINLAVKLYRQSRDFRDLHAAYSAVEQGRARVFLEALSRDRAAGIGGVPEKLRLQEQTLLAQFHSLGARIQRENNQPVKQRETDLMVGLYDERKQTRQKLDGFIAELERDYPGYAALKYPRPISLERARECLEKNEVAVLFTVEDAATWAVIVQKEPAQGDLGKGLAVVKLPGQEVLATKVRTLVRPEVLRSDSDCRRRGAELHDLLLKPLAEYIRGKDLVLAPDGVLWELPFELLVEGRTQHSHGSYLVESRLVRYALSLSVLDVVRRWDGRRARPLPSVWALADPIFDPTDPRLSAPGRLTDTDQLALRLLGVSKPPARLAATAVEARTLRGLFDRCTVLTGGEAGEAAMKRASEKGELAQARYVHLATHGVLGARRNRQPALALNLVGNGGEAQLGGDNDGLLTPAEVINLRLNADLVVLSACETGRGNFRASEGVIGQSRAFLYAGTRGVLCSLWQVDDEQTSRLMQGLYSGLKADRPAAQALAEAQRKLIVEEHAPFYWAPFILVGQ